jgi:hypothetical protein
MKSKIVTSCLFFLVIFSSSCKKDSFPGLVGQWVSIAYYRNENGTFNWLPASMMRFPDHISFTADSRFYTSTDVSGISGTYVYDNRLNQLTLNIEADIFGNAPSSNVLKVENLNNARLIVAYYYSTGDLAEKTEYSRVD